MAKRTANLFRNGRNQAVRLPREFTLDADEVYIERRGEEIVLRPKPRSWDDYFIKPVHTLPEDFPDQIDDMPPQERESF